MKLYYKGKFGGNEDILPSGELEKHKNVVRFKEISDMKQPMIGGNIVSAIMILILEAIFILRAGGKVFNSLTQMPKGARCFFEKQS